MDIDLMRVIDRRVGIPICFLLTLLHNICEKLGKIHSGVVTVRPKILFVELSEMGSTILAYAAMKKALNIFPGAKLYFLIFKQNSESLSLLNMIPDENVLTIRTHSFIEFVIDTLSVVWRLRKAKIDIAIDLELFSRFTSILPYLFSAKKRVGFYRYTNEGLYRGELLTHRVAYNPYQHISLNYLSLLYALECPAAEMPAPKRRLDPKEIIVPHLNSDQAEKDIIWKKLKEVNPQIDHSNSIVILNPHAGELLPIRAWPLKNYVELTRRLLQDPKLYVVIIGTKEAHRDAEEICREVNEGRCMNLTEQFKLKELIHLFNISHILVTNDSGPAHFACLTSIKNFIFFGPETPELYAPVGINCTPLYASFACSPCVSAFNHRKTPCNDNKCLQSISVDYVYSMIIKSLKPS